MFNTTTSQTRSFETRDSILSTALSLFRQEGLDATTMRDIAKRAGVALGAAYYYYPSKQAILQAYYDHVQKQHHTRVLEALAGDKSLTFEERLKLVFHAKLDILRQDRKILGALFRYAGEPTHPLSALGPATRKTREQTIATFALAIQDEKLPDDIRGMLPAALWAVHMAMLLYFVYDDSPDQARSRKLVDGAIGLFSSLLFLASMPMIKPFRGRLISLLNEAGLVRALSSEQE